MKKSRMTLVAITAFVFLALAPGASASNITENGVTLAAGASITYIETGTFHLTNGSATVTCNYGHMAGTITQDGGGRIVVEVPAGSEIHKGTGPNEECTSELGSVKSTTNSKLCFEINNSDTGVVTGCGANLTFTMNYTGLISCRYLSASMAFTVGTGGAAAITISEQPASEEGGLFLCPDSAKLDMIMDLTTTDGTPLTVS